MYRLVIILAFAVAFSFNGNAQRKRAFMVGISNYHSNGYKVWDNIHGAEDIMLLTPELEKKGFKVQSLTNEAATYQGIQNALTQFIAASKKGDIIYIHFSCHGQPVEDGLLKGYPKDEKDGYDEAIVPIDAGKEYSSNGYKGEKHLIDDELNGYIKSLRTKIGSKGVLYVIIDACHAGESSRKGIETVRGTNEALTSQKNKNYNPPRDTIRHYNVEKALNLSPVLFIEACKARERNTEIIIKGKEYGALSYNIWHALQEMDTLDKNAKEKFKTCIEASTKINGRWPRTQTLVIEE